MVRVKVLSSRAIPVNVKQNDVNVWVAPYNIIHSSDNEIYTGVYEVTPKPRESVQLDTKDKLLIDNITVNKIPYFATSNNNGTTIYIGDEVKWQ